MSRQAPSDLDIHLGSAVLPAQVRRVRTDHRGALSLSVESEDHDLGLLRSLATAVREEPGVVEHLCAYADLRDDMDAAEREDNYPLRRSLADEADDVYGLIERALSWQTVGEPLVASLRPEETSELVAALTEAPALHEVKGGAA